MVAANQYVSTMERDVLYVIVNDDDARDKIYTLLIEAKLEKKAKISISKSSITVAFSFSQ